MLFNYFKKKITRTDTRTDIYPSGSEGGFLHIS